MAFPRHTKQWTIQELSAWRRLSVSRLGSGVAIGVIVRGYRWLMLTLFPSPSGALVLVLLVSGLALLCGLATLHLANFTLRSWRTRAPLLGVIIALGEAATSLVLVALGQERIGRVVATFGDWPSIAFGILYSRLIVVSLFALVLAAAVLVLRKTDLANE